MEQILLSPHFTLEEMTVTKTGLKNVPNVSQINHLRMLCVNILEPLRERIGQPIHVNSAFRSSLVNKAVGGVATSQHLSGDAADITSSVQTSCIWNAINDLVLHGFLNVGQCICCLFYYYLFDIGSATLSGTPNIKKIIIK